MEFESLLRYSLPIIVMALIVSVLVGIIKIFIKPKIKSEWLSRLYFLIALLLSVGAAAFYYGVIEGKTPFVTLEFYQEAGAVIGATQVIYSLYRKFGGRTLFLYIARLFKGKDSRFDQIVEIVEQILKENSLLNEENKELVHNSLVDGLKGKVS
jgi:hypothetical protein